MSEILHKELTEKIICAFYNVYNSLGYGFLELVYQKALIIELNAMGLKCGTQKPVRVYYRNAEVGEYFPDIIVEGKVILELKSAEAMHPRFEAQLVNYLRATPIEVGLLLNFGPRAEFKRKVYTNDRKDLGDSSGNTITPSS